VRLRYVARLAPPVHGFGPEAVGDEISFLPLDRIWADDRFDPSEAVEFNGDIGSYNPVNEGDLLLPKVSPTFAHGRCAIAEGLVGGRALATSEAFVLRANDPADRRFLRYRLLAPDFLSAGQAAWTGVAGLKRVSADFVKDVSIDADAWSRRHQVADFLDRETERICVALDRTDHAARPVEQLVAVVTDAVSDEDRHRLKHGLRGALTYGASENSGEGEPEWPRFIRITDIDGHGALRDDVRRLAPTVAAQYMLDDGDVLFARSGATVGKSFLYRRDLHGSCCYAGYLVRARCEPTRLLPEFLILASLSARWWDQIALALTQATIPNVSAARYGEMLVPMPDLRRQHEIVELGRRRSQAASTVRARHVEVVTRLTEYRSALIHEAVNGKLDVTNVSDRQMEERLHAATENRLDEVPA
jgi:hypothetical protein